ncbi:MAG: VWA domain-containing protein [Pseudomonadales bacterium]
MSGPTFERLPQPVEQRTDALVIALDLSLSMYAQDVDPSRLVRARQKIVDILRQRREGYTALVAYAGSAHAVAPLTDDTRTIENLLETLEPAMMPVAGSRPNAALEVIENLFANAAVTQGRILFVTDGVDDIAEVSAFRNPYFPISVIGVGTPDGATIPLDFVQQPGRVLTTRDGEAIIARLDDDRLREVAELAYGRYARLTLSDADINTALSTTLPGDEDSEAIDREFDLWHDLGYWFAVLALPCLLFGFRRGVLACCALALLPGASHASLWDDLWQRDDQQAYQAMRNGEPERAATLTERPDWRGAAEYRSGNYNAAISAFSRLDDLTATYNLGNALARSGDLDGAIAAYDKVLDSDPNFEDAAFNKDLIERQRQKQQEADQQDNDEKQQESENDSEQSRDGQSDGSQQQDDASPQQGADDSEQKGEEQQQSADSGKQGEPEEGAEEDQADSRSEQADALEQWLRRVPDDPGGLLRRKFQYENQQRLRSGDYRYRQGEKIW